jgi:16S rRNA (guanine527-N7)-methyltransferase
MPDDHLLSVLATIRERGPIGEASLVDAVRRADAFVASVPGLAVDLVDLGSGGGFPGLVIAVRRPDLRITLVERRTTRADLLHRAVRALDLGERCTVSTEDAEMLARRSPASVDVVTARSFAAPAVTARIGAALLRPGGHLLVAEPPEEQPDRWPPELLTSLHLVDLGRREGVRAFVRQ